jgi:hypothetical protein
MEYAQLTPGRRFAPLHSLLYYSQRIVTRPLLRRLVVRALSGALRLRQGSGRDLWAATSTEEASLLELRSTGYAPLGNLLDTAQCGEIRAFLEDKLLFDRDRARHGFTLAHAPEQARVADYHLRDVIGCPHILALANSPPLLGLAARYMACKPTISALGLRWSFPQPGNSSAASARKAWCRADGHHHLVGLRHAAEEPGRHDSEPAARPKLIDSCWKELEMVLAMLESFGAMSA